ncbi:uncharacterized protein LOC120648246 [Panicum virgatum]|nr:uncharacterized protein LOC120648246 [Panicum virgatum]
MAMAKLASSSPLVLALVLVAAAMAAVATSDAGDRLCHEDLMNAAAHCQNYLTHPAEPKIPPSEKCCRAVGDVTIPCLCSFVTEQFEKGVCMEKLVFVFDYCNNPLRPGCKCGSYKVPPLGLGLEGNDC